MLKMAKTVYILIVLSLVGGHNTEDDTTEYLSKYEHYIDERLKNMADTITELKTKLESKETWPPGSYCIFANGNCPAGFTRHAGHMIAISTYAASSTYIRTASFGSSKIACHGRCGQWPNWYGELHIVACCK